MPKKGENIYKRKDGRWEGRYIKRRNHDGKALYGYVYARTYREVKSKLAACRATAQTAASQEKPSSLPFQYLAQQWLLSIELQVKQSTLIKYRGILNVHLLPEFSGIAVGSITDKKLEEFGLKLLRIRSQKTVADIFSVFRAILYYASHNGQILTCDPRSFKIKRAAVKIRVLTLEEQTILTQYLLKHSDSYSVGILLCLYTGLRLGEVCALRWEDISLSQQVIHINHTMQRIQAPAISGAKTDVTVTSPKSISSIRTIPIPECLLSILYTYCQSDSGYFLTNQPERYIEPRLMQYHFRKYVQKCGIPDVNFHTLRHTFATRCVELGFDIKSLSEILGHSSVSITLNRYVHPSMELKKKNMQRLSQLFAVK